MLLDIPVTLPKHSFSRSYGVNLPSSLTWVLSSALGFSPRPPVSVCGTVTAKPLLEAFFSSVGSSPSPYLLRGPISSRLSRNRGLPCDLSLPPSSWVLALPPTGNTLLRHLIDNVVPPWCGILTSFPSPTSLELGLGPTNPGRINLAQETLVLRRTGFSPVLSLLVPTFSFLPRPPLLTVWLQPTVERSPTPYESTNDP